MISDPLALLEADIWSCTACPRLTDFRTECRSRQPDYWARPVAGFGDPTARLFILGLAPGYHGANRHGRVFTGDSSGRWLWGALHALGAASLPDSLGPGDGMELRDVWISNAARCVPPGNRPTTEELTTCREFLARELASLPRITVVLALGQVAHDTYLKLQGERLARYPFGHGARHTLPGAPSHLLDSYHPSRQNTNTGVLKWEMWLSVIRGALTLASEDYDPACGRTTR